MALCFALACLPAYSQPVKKETTAADTVSKGYWVIENNRREPDHAIIYFYTEEGTLIYKETVHGIRLKISRNLKQRLDTALGKVVEAHEKNQPLENEREIVLAIIGK